MEAVADGLWELADHHEKKGEMAKAIKCLEAICQSKVSFLPIVEVKTRLRVSTLLLKHSHNSNHAKAHLERAQLLLKSIPSCFELKCRACSLLSQCYHLAGATASQKQILNKGLELTATSVDGKMVLSFSLDASLCATLRLGYVTVVKNKLVQRFAGRLWFCNFNSQLANALIIEGDYQGSITALEQGYICAAEMCYLELQMFFASSVLHVHLMQWGDMSLVEGAFNRCNVLWESVEPDKRQQCLGLMFYNDLLHVFYLLRICDYKTASQHVERLDSAMKSDIERTGHVQVLKKELEVLNASLSRAELSYRDRSALTKKRGQLEEQLANYTGQVSAGKDSLEAAYFGNVTRACGDKLELAPPPIDGQWLPKGAVFALIDLTVVVFSRPKGLFKECGKRIQTGMQTIQEELAKLGISNGAKEVDLQHSSIWMAGVYLTLVMHFLENKVAVDLTRSEFIEAQLGLVEMRNWYIRFPTILQACECTIEMLRGQYAHSVGCYPEATFHFREASKNTESRSMQAMCDIYAAISYICLGDAESSAKALDLIGPIYSEIDSFVGVREKTSVLLAYGLLLTRQQNLQDARFRLASGLQITHNHVGNLQLVSQYLTALGSLALALHDAGQAREILRSSLTLAKKLYDIPTQIWVLSNLTALYQQLGEEGSETENLEYQKKKVNDLQRRIADACSSVDHIELVDKVKLQASEIDIKRASAGPSSKVELDIPESIGLPNPSPMPPSSRLMDVDLGRLGRRIL